MYVYLCICMYLNIHTKMYLCGYIYIIYLYIYIYIYEYIHICTYTIITLRLIPGNAVDRRLPFFCTCKNIVFPLWTCMVDKNKKHTHTSATTQILSILKPRLSCVGVCRSVWHLLCVAVSYSVIQCDALHSVIQCDALHSVIQCDALHGIDSLDSEAAAHVCCSVVQCVAT